MKFFTVPALRVPTKMEDDFFVTADGIPEWARLNGRQCYIGGRAANYFNLCVDGDDGGHSVDAGCKGFCDLIAIIVYDIVDAIEAASNVVHCPGVVHAIEAEGMYSVLGAQIFHAYGVIITVRNDDNETLPVFLLSLPVIQYLLRCMNKHK